MKSNNTLCGISIAVVLQFGVLAGSAQTNKYLFTGSESNITLPPGTYNITAYGAQGGNGTGGAGGLGAEMEGQFNFAEETTLTLLVGGGGGTGDNLFGYYEGGGGGGSFVVNGSTPLVIAGGGGGTAYTGAALAGVTSANGGTSTGYGPGAGGTGGGGGYVSTAGTSGGGGGGFYSNGENGAFADGGGSFLSGGAGGSGFSFGYGDAGSGGYGGGGGSTFYGGGGGGGYSGGGSPEEGGGAGGGGSIINSSAIMDLAEISGIASPDDSPNGEIIIIAANPPVITNQPTHTTVSTGGAVMFSVGVSGSPSLKYQWMFNGTNMSGATNAALSIANVSATKLGFYSVTITNYFGGVTSAPAGLFIADPTSLAGLIVTGPAGSNYDVQATATLANGGQWTTLTNISLPAQPYTYIDFRSQTNPMQFYRLAITNAAAHPANAWGNLATLKLERFAKLAVQWPAGASYNLESLPVSGSVTNWTTLANFGPAAQPYIYLDYSSATNPQSYRVVPGPAFSSQPASTTVGSGGTAVFNPGVSNTPPFVYQWTFNGTNIAGATNLSLTITNVSPANVGLYALTIINGAAPVTSTVASLATVDLKQIAGLIISGPIGSNCAVQATATLGAGSLWATLTNISLASQPGTWIDYGSLTNPQQFYRLAVTNAPTPPTLVLDLFASLVINGPAGLNYNVQALGNSGWTTLTNISLPSQPYIFIDYNSPTNPQQSYRATPQ